jgi:hypothetical protein
MDNMYPPNGKEGDSSAIYLHEGAYKIDIYFPKCEMLSTDQL